MSAPFFAAWGEELLAADGDALRETMRVLDAKESVRSALQSADVPACVKRALKCIRLAESAVPGTDGYLPPLEYKLGNAPLPKHAGYCAAQARRLLNARAGCCISTLAAEQTCRVKNKHVVC